MPVDIPLIANATTWKMLQQCRNQAATGLLGAGLASFTDEVRHRCLRVLIARNCDVGFKLILQNWERFDHRDLGLIREHSKGLCRAVRSLVDEGSLRDRKLALAAISELELADCLDILLDLAINGRHPLHASAGCCLHSLCGRLGRAARQGQSPSSPVRLRLLKKLHGRIMSPTNSPALLDAWLSVVHWDDSLQQCWLSEPGHPAYSKLLARLASSNEPATLQLLAGYLWWPATPRSILSILFEHTNPHLLVEMAKLLSEESLPGVLDKLRASPPLACMATLDLKTLELDGKTEHRLLRLLAASSEDLSWTLSTCLALAQSSRPESVQLAAQMLLSCKRPPLQDFVRLLQAELVLPADQQPISNCVHQLQSWRSSSFPELRDAANEFLADFTIENLFLQIPRWPAQLCRVMAQIVVQAETDILPVILQHLTSPAPRKRLAALQVIDWLHCADRLRDELLELLQDPRLEVRVRVIDTLSTLPEEVLEGIIPQLLQDNNTDIIDAAHRARRRLERRKQSPRDVQTAN